MPLDSLAEARRQLEICNACRYCEGYCSVFPAITRKRVFSDGDVTQLANLCHNCRGCYYACQYTHPHEFALNIPAVLADVRTDSWERFAWPVGFGGLFQRHGVAVAALLVFAVGLLLAIAAGWQGDGDGFYAVMPHNVMVAVFVPAFLLPLLVMGIGLRRYWKHVEGTAIRPRYIIHALAHAARLKDLSGGQGQGCNFEIGDRYSNARRWFHQAVLYGFMLCFAATGFATVMHYLMDLPAPYDLISLPKLLGVPGGIGLAVGSGGLAILKTKAKKSLGAASAWGGEMAFVLLLFVVAVSGLALYAATGTSWVAGLLALHLGAVFAFFILVPNSKMAHGFYRLAALVRDAQTRAP
ncbi:tricarballylate utilization 4Fe-4S protein TcuB [Magnetospira sp. QH-2]|uniref:tricarballylate utilization 4Fe-4S protein TcuB n=1 Tax=Magnetospira sp. (strain QH-2) TaxID=1288970 RepID=UPI0003E811DF|nr:tricarballylate utilization 4Fe-4S protein TcuB [Magnetospira sp. QH-2]CCQ72556.1 putative membrane 4Fe-4S ferredoxin [Magnetospira sp. QH-2]